MTAEYKYTNGNPFFALCEHDVVVLAAHENGGCIHGFAKTGELLEKNGKVKLNNKVLLERL